MINTGHALSVLETVYPNQGELHQGVTKLLDVARSQYQLRLKRYERDLTDIGFSYPFRSRLNEARNRTRMTRIGRIHADYCLFYEVAT